MLLLLLACSSEKAEPVASDPPALPEDCSPLDPWVDEPIQVAPGEALEKVLANAPAGSTIVLEDGTYPLDVPLEIRTDGLILRSLSGEPSAVILDGMYAVASILEIQASKVTVSGISMVRSYGPAVHVQGTVDGDITGVHLYDVVIRDAGEEALRIEPNQGHYADAGVVGCSQILRSASGRSDPSATCAGGIDGVAAAGWRIYGNDLHGFWCEQDPAWALRFRDGSRDTIIERNRIYDSSGLIALGDDQGPLNDPRPPAGDCPEAEEIEEEGGMIRNNFLGLASSDLGSGFRTGILLAQACNVSLLHNTLWSSPAPLQSLQLYGPDTSGIAANNLMSPAFAGSLTLDHNGTAQATDFVSADDLHLVDDSPAIDAGTPLEPGAADEDIDRDARDALPDLGADEF